MYLDFVDAEGIVNINWNIFLGKHAACVKGYGIRIRRSKRQSKRQKTWINIG